MPQLGEMQKSSEGGNLPEPPVASEVPNPVQRTVAQEKIAAPYIVSQNSRWQTL
jgi:hypothetical protein